MKKKPPTSNPNYLTLKSLDEKVSKSNLPQRNAAIIALKLGLATPEEKQLLSNTK